MFATIVSLIRNGTGHDRQGIGMKTVGPATRLALLPAQAGPAITLFLLAPVAPAIADYFGSGGTDAAQKIVTFPFLGLVLGSLLCGNAIRQFGLKPLVLIASLAFMACGVIGLCARDLPLLLFGGTLLGLGAAFMTSSMSGVTSLFYDGQERARLVSHQSAAGNLIAAVLGLMSATLAGHFGWRTPFGAFGLFGFAMLALCLAFIPATPRDTQTPSGKVIPVFMRIWPVCLAGCVIYAIATNQSTNLPFLLAQNGIASAALRSLVTITTSLAAMVGAFSYGAVQGRLDHLKLDDRKMIAVAGIVGATGWFLFAYWQGGLMPALVGAALLGICIGILMPILFTTSMRRVDGADSGAAIGLLTACIFLGSFVSPILFTPLRELAGLSGMMIWVGTITLVVALIAFLWARSPNLVRTNSEPII
jgi:MFS family permease